MKYADKHAKYHPKQAFAPAADRIAPAYIPTI